jgi:hypothetical protein
MIYLPRLARGIFFVFRISKSHHENRDGSFQFTANFARIRSVPFLHSFLFHILSARRV